jgi:hypothetical protein
LNRTTIVCNFQKTLGNKKKGVNANKDRKRVGRLTHPPTPFPQLGRWSSQEQEVPPARQPAPDPCWDYSDQVAELGWLGLIVRGGVFEWKSALFLCVFLQRSPTLSLSLIRSYDGRRGRIITIEILEGEKHIFEYLSWPEDT